MGISRLALLTLAATALLLVFAAGPAAAQPAIIDYDVDNDGLIDVDSLAKLNAIRWDLNGDGLVAPGDQASYAAAFPNPEAGMGCKPADHDDSALTADQPVCTGYELTADLDFNTNTNTDTGGGIVIDSQDDYWNAGKGWSPIGSESAPYMAVFDGGRHTIANLFINRPTSSMVQFRDVNKSNYVGLFASLMSPGEIRHLRLTGVSVTGRANVGAVVGHITLGKVSHVSSTGAVSAVGNSGGDGQKAGGLVGSTGASAAVIEYSYSTATATAGDDYAGGLIGENKGIIRASYATGAVTAGEDKAGGLAGNNSGTITASYATGAAQGDNEVGGLAGSNSGTITASYANGAVSSTDTPAGSDLGGLTGTNTGTVTNGYWDTTTSGQAGGVGKTTSELQTPTAYGSSPSIYADWNVNTDGVAGADDPWDFGTASQYPALKADFDGDGTPTAYEFGRQGRSAPVDYDADNDNLIDVDTLAQLNAMRWDMDGNGSNNAGYTAAFPNPAAGMGCPAACAGYELTADLDFNTDTSTDVSGEAVIDSKDAYWNGGAGWSPIGAWGDKFRTTFDGAGHSISNLHINRSSMDYAGLFGVVGAATIRNLGLNDVNVVGKNYIGTVAGTLSTDATIDTVYVTGSVRGVVYIGGVIGELYQPSRMRNVYNAAAVTATGVGGGGGLAGYIPNYTAAVIIRDSYSFGLISGADTGGLSSVDSSIITHTQTYWDTQVSGQAANPSGGVGKTTSELQAPTSRTEDMDDATAGVQNIYSGWDAAVWDFGTASQYPALKYDTDGDGTATWQEFGRQGRSAPVDYDTDNDNLIEITTLAQLNALRWDLNGDGSVASSDQANYETAFPSPAAGMGCHATCAGYELEADLDFNTDTTTDVSGEAVIDDQDAYWNSGSGWVPIGADSLGARYNTVFKGNGHTISNLFIDRSGTSDVGLFGATGTGSEVRMVGLENVNVTGHNYVGGLAGTGRGDFRSTYTTGSVSSVGSVGDVGGLVGYYDAAGKAIAASYSTARVTGSRNYQAGGLVGQINDGAVLASYATGAVTATENVGGLVGFNKGAVVGSYATGAVTGTTAVGGLVGYRSGSGSATNSYWDTTTSGQANSDGGVGKATSDLQSPTAYGSGSDIYAAWNVDVDNADNDNDRTSGTDDPWDFGTGSQYPALKADFDGDGRPTAYEFGRQGRSAPLPVDYDTDNDGLIDITTLAQLNALRWDLDGDGTASSGDEFSYGTAFHNPKAGMGCKLGDHDDNAATPNQPVCIGYELEMSLDFNTDTTTDVSGEAVIDDQDDYWNGGAGWNPIGNFSNQYSTVFEGNGHTISNLFINRPSTDGVGLFSASGADSEIRRVGLEDVDVTGKSSVGGLAGNAAGAIRATYTNGTVTGRTYVGGQVGFVVGSAIRLSYSNAAVTATVAEVGGLVGHLHGGSAVASYATGSVTGENSVGGLAGTVSDSSIVASYATGVLTGTTNVGGLLGKASGSTITNSYWDTTTSGQSNSAGGGAGKTTSQLQTPVAYGSGSDIYADWNVNTDGVAGADDPWDFGTGSQYPALKADFDGDGTPTAYEFGRQGRSAPLPVDYDADDDNLIDVNTLAQLNAMRWDLDGDGVSANAGYTTAFPNPAAGMGCPATCTGYELETDLDFDQNNDDTITSVDSAYWNGGAGWEPIGDDGNPYNTVFEGNGHTISNLFINRSASDQVGLFGASGTDSEVRRVGLEDVDVTGQNSVGGLTGYANGAVRATYTNGTVTGGYAVGGLAGFAGDPVIRLSYSNAAVTATGNYVGGLVGNLHRGSVVASYATGAVTGDYTVGGLAGIIEGSSIVASYATGAVTGTSDLGGLAGTDTAGSTMTNSYWDTVTTGQSGSAGGVGKTTSQLQTPTAYGSSPSIYANWNVDVDGVAGADDPWGFGTGSQYPALKADFDGDGTPTAYEFGRQGRSAPTNLAPAFATATGSRSVAENTAAGQNIGNPITASDPDVGDTLTYSLGTTADDGHFAIVAASGQLQTKDPLDYESTTSYTVTVTATDGDGLTDTVTVTINVTDVDEPPPTPGSLNVVPDVGFFYFNWQAVPASDMVGIPPVTAYEVQYRKRISTGPDVWEDWTDHPNPVGPHYISSTIRGLTPGETYGMRVRAKNHEGESPWSLPATGVPNPYANTAPSFTEGATATRSVAENTAGGQDIGNPVAATDVNAGDTLTYSLRGTDASHFQLDTATGQLQTKGTLDYEAKDSYQVIVRVTDGKDRDDNNSNVIDDTITVTIEVTDVNEPPTAAPSNVGVASAPLGLEVTWTAPSAGAGRPPVNGYDVRYRRHSVGGVGAWQDHNHRGANARARIRGLTPGDTYGVEVRAKNHEGTGPFSATASGQAGAAPSGVDYDDDDDGLIEVDSLEQLNAIRWNPNGDGVVTVGGVVTAADKDAYDLTFPGPALGMGCPAADHDDDVNTPDQPTCTGYELNKDLDFNTDTFTDNDDGAVIDSSDAYWNGGLGWDPIRFYGTFEGNRHTISHLFINRPDRDEVGLFSRVGFRYTKRIEIRRVGLVNVQDHRRGARGRAGRRGPRVHP